MTMEHNTFLDTIVFCHISLDLMLCDTVWIFKFTPRILILLLSTASRYLSLGYAMIWFVAEQCILLKRYITNCKYGYIILQEYTFSYANRSIPWSWIITNCLYTFSHVSHNSLWPWMITNSSDPLCSLHQTPLSPGSPVAPVTIASSTGLTLWMIMTMTWPSWQDMKLVQDNNMALTRWIIYQDMGNNFQRKVRY